MAFPRLSPPVASPWSISKVGPHQNYCSTAGRFTRNRLISCAILTTKEKIAAAKTIADKLNQSVGPTAFIMPLEGIDEWDREGGRFETRKASRHSRVLSKRRSHPKSSITHSTITSTTMSLPQKPWRYLIGGPPPASSLSVRSNLPLLSLRLASFS